MLDTKRDLWTLDCHNLSHGVAAGDVSERFGIINAKYSN
jgi:hypothetical protein